MNVDSWSKKNMQELHRTTATLREKETNGKEEKKDLAVNTTCKAQIALIRSRHILVIL